MPNSGLTAIGNSGPSGDHAPHMERYLMAPQPWMSRMPIEVNRKVVEMGQTCSASSMGPQQKGFLMAPQPWVDKNVDGDRQEMGHGSQGGDAQGAHMGGGHPRWETEWVGGVGVMAQGQEMGEVYANRLWGARQPWVGGGNQNRHVHVQKVEKSI